jgi:hypothetical protein
MPATIDDPVILNEIGSALKGHGWGEGDISALDQGETRVCVGKRGRPNGYPRAAPVLGFISYGKYEIRLIDQPHHVRCRPCIELRRNTANQRATHPKNYGLRFLLPPLPGGEIMKVAVIAVLFGLITTFTATAGQNDRQAVSLAIACDNNGRCTASNTAAPEPHRKRTHTVAAPAVDANGNTAGTVISHNTGARARVGVAYAARFQAYIDDLESNYGARVLFMGGIRPGRCSIYSEHPCGKALDVCQLRRGVVDPRCHLPGRQELGRIAASHGLFEGGLWCDSDYGHAQIDVTAPACADRAAGAFARQ